MPTYFIYELRYYLCITVIKIYVRLVYNELFKCVGSNNYISSRTKTRWLDVKFNFMLVFPLSISNGKAMTVVFQRLSPG